MDRERKFQVLLNKDGKGNLHSVLFYNDYNDNNLEAVLDDEWSISIACKDCVDVGAMNDMAFYCGIGRAIIANQEWLENGTPEGVEEFISTYYNATVTNAVSPHDFSGIVFKTADMGLEKGSNEAA